MVEEDSELAEIKRRCLGGELLCGQCKKETAERVLAFIRDFREKMEASAHLVKVE